MLFLLLFCGHDPRSSENFIRHFILDRGFRNVQCYLFGKYGTPPQPEEKLAEGGSTSGLSSVCVCCVFSTTFLRGTHGELGCQGKLRLQLSTKQARRAQ